MIGFKRFIFHNGTSYGVVKQVHINRFVDPTTSAILHDSVNELQNTLECDCVIQQNEIVMFCNEIPNVTWEEIS
jgi:2-hydroxy-3-keto-5-methylthiopentenyl-1-phosphate phosphatase